MTPPNAPREPDEVAVALNAIPRPHPTDPTIIQYERNGTLRELEEVAKAMFPPAEVRLHPQIPGIAECVVDNVVVSWHKIVPDSTPIPYDPVSAAR